MTPARRLAVRSALGLLWFGLWFFGVFPLGIHVLAGRALRVEAGPGAAMGGLLVAGSQALVVTWIARFVREGRGTPVPLQPPQRLVASGPFRWMRNPMYAAYIATICGEALLLGSAPIAIYAACFAGLAHAYVVRVEEPALAHRFGSAYRDYCARVPRWLPGSPQRSARSRSSKSASSPSSKTPS